MRESRWSNVKQSVTLGFVANFVNLTQATLAIRLNLDQMARLYEGPLDA